VHVRQIGASIFAGLLLLVLMVPQLVLAAGPTISNVQVTEITSTSARVSWNVTTSSTITENRVNYGTAIPPDRTAYNTLNVPNPSIVLTGLAPGSTYYFEVRSTDASNTSTTDNRGGLYYSFTTLPAYSLSLEPTCGVCGELYETGVCNEIIEATAAVAAGSTEPYYICWDSPSAANVVAWFRASTAGVYSVTFFLPEATRGPHNVYLTDNTYAQKASTVFTVNPSVKISPEKGPVGTTVTLKGYGFNATQSVQVALFQGETAKGETKSTTADSRGSWTANYTIPAIPAGHYIFKIQVREGTAEPVTWVMKDFEVTPKITADPDRGKVGDTVEIAGTGFGRDESGIAVTFAGEVRAANIRADEKGSWTAVITVPPRQSGTYAIDASGTRTRARDVEDVNFILSAGILLEPNPAYVGQTIIVKGGGFRPLETGIRVTFGGQVVATVPSAGVNGSWQASFVLSPTPYGGNPVSAQGDITAPVTNTLTVNARIKEVSPLQGAPGDTVSLTGSGFGSSKKLTVTVGGPAATEDMRSQPNGDVVISFRVPKGVTAGKQVLRVTDESGAADSVEFTVTRKTLASPLPTLPANGSRSRSGIVTFHWQGTTSGSGFTYTYILEVSTSPGGAAVRSTSGIEGLSYTLAKEEALDKGTYYWRVKAVDNYGNESEWSQASELIVSPIPTWVWVVVGIVVLLVLMVVAYRETKFKVTE